MPSFRTLVDYGLIYGRTGSVWVRESSSFVRRGFEPNGGMNHGILTCDS